MTLRFGFFDHIEPVPGLGLDRINRLGGVALAGSPAAMCEYMDEYLATGADYFVCSFQWGGLSHWQARRSIDLFVKEVLPHYAF